jgi:pyruvate/2-oxoglutarate dehydrogenase complex dihydrolipoamide acyltransferase (E2) component
MAIEVILPKVDMDMATGIIALWHVKEGDTVKKGMPLFDIETDKAAMEVECPADGIIGNITAQKGAVVPVGQSVAHIYQAGETQQPLKVFSLHWLHLNMFLPHLWPSAWRGKIILISNLFLALAHAGALLQPMCRHIAPLQLHHLRQH